MLASSQRRYVPWVVRLFAGLAILCQYGYTAPASHAAPMSITAQNSGISTNGLKLWLKADTGLFSDAGCSTPVVTDGDPVGCWKDQSGNGLNVTTTANSARPKYRVNRINGKPAIDYDGGNDRLSTTATQLFATGSSPLSVITVFRTSDYSSPKYLINQTAPTACTNGFELGYDTGIGASFGNFGLSKGCNNATIAPANTVLQNTFYMMGTFLDSAGNSPANVSIFKDGLTQSLSNDNSGYVNAGSYNTTAAPIDIGARFDSASSAFTNFHKGDIAEVIIFQRALTTAERQELECYLGDKYAISVPQCSQTITFDALGDKTYGNQDFTVSATASSGLPVSFSATGKCSINGTTVHITGAGSCNITASQAGNTMYQAAPDVVRSFVIAKANQTITFDELQPQAAGDSLSIGATTSSGLPVSFSVAGNCTLSGTTVYLNSGGSCTITATQTGDANYNAAPAVERRFDISKANQTIIFGALENKTFGDDDVEMSATASSGLAVSFAVSGDCSLNGTTVRIAAAGECTVTASQAGDDMYNPAEDVAQSFTIARADQTITFDALGDKTFTDADFAIDAHASSGLPVSFGATGSCTVDGKLVHIAGAGECSITASQPGYESYNAAKDVVRTFTIAKAPQTITFASISDKTYGDDDFAPQATSTSGLAVSFADPDPADGCTVAGGSVTINRAGTCAIRAVQQGNTNYNSASADATINVAKANQVIVLETTKRIDANTFVVNATATSGLLVEFSVDGNCTIDGTTVRLNEQGSATCTVQANQTGDERYNAAASTTTQVVRTVLYYLPLLTK